MEMDKIDKNYKDKSIKVTGKTKTYTLPCEPLDLYNCFYDEKDGHFLRMPADLANSISWGLNVLKMMPSGGRVRFSTNSKTIGVNLKFEKMVHPFNSTPVMVAGLILIEENSKGGKFVRTFAPKKEEEECGYSQSYPLGNGRTVKQYTLYLPNYVKLEKLELTFDKNAIVDHGIKYREDVKPILYYGGSLTEGFCATRSDNSLPGFIGKWTNIDYINLGFTGNSKGEPQMADYLATIDCSFFIFNLDYNVDTIEDLKERHLPLYLKFRKTHPTTPIIFFSFPAEWPSTNKKDNIKLRREVTKATYEYAINNGDKNIYYYNGNDLLKGFDRCSMQVDGDHPNDLGFYIMAKRMFKQIKKMYKNIGVII